MELAIGIGCTRGAPATVLAAAVDAVLARHALAPEAVYAVASIDAKRGEPGLVALAQARGWALLLYDAAALAALALAHPSPVVARRVGTPAVAEPAARLAAGRGPLRVPKTVYTAAGHAVTVAVAARSTEPAHA